MRRATRQERSLTIESMRRESGQATVEWTALVVAAAIVFAGLGYAISRTDSWALGHGVVRAIACGIGLGCDDEGADSLALAYGKETAALVRRYAPNVTYERRSAELPVDFRSCRKLECSNGSDGPREIDRTSAGLAVTAFTRVVDRRAGGGALYLQYWFYYPESFTGGIGRMFGHRWPGYHADDWEGYQIRVPRDGSVMARATAHGGYSGGWVPSTGWYRVSGGSHAGQIPGRSDGERTTTASGLALTPLERLGDLELQHFAITPPWLKAVYRDPESESS
jgi:hypothetical protein